MGVSGSGKSTIGALLAQALGLPFVEGDTYHSPHSVEKMRAGIPLEDEDRMPWLKRVGEALLAAAQAEGGAVAACSALKRKYRDEIRKAAGDDVAFVYLDGDSNTIAPRQANRPGHYFPPSLLQSQFDTLEPPEAEENAITVSVNLPKDEIIAKLAQAFPA